MVGAAQTTTAWCSTDSACSSGPLLQTCSSVQPPDALEEVTAAGQVAVVVKTAAIPDQQLHTEVRGFLQGGSGEEDDEDESNKSNVDDAFKDSSSMATSILTEGIIK